MTAPSQPSEASRSAELVAAVASLREQLEARPLNDARLTLGLAKLRGKLSKNDSQDRALADEVLALLLDPRCDWSSFGLPCLEALARTGARPTPHSQAATTCEKIWPIHSLTEDFGNDKLTRTYTALIELDVDIEGAKHLYDDRVPAPESAGHVIERYLRLRAQTEVRIRPRDAHSAYAGLVAVGRDPSLGPVTRARALSEGSFSVRDPRARVALMEEAKRLDPGASTAYLFWAHSLLWAGKTEQGWRELQEAWLRWRAQYRSRKGCYAIEGDRLDLSLRFLLRSGLTPEARVLHEESKKDPLWIPSGGGARGNALLHHARGTRKARLETWLEEGGAPVELGRRPRRSR